MPTQSELCLAHAREAHLAAEAATLTNVRELHLRSEKTWAEMAARAAASERARVEAEALRLMLRSCSAEL